MHKSAQAKPRYTALVLALVAALALSGCPAKKSGKPGKSGKSAAANQAGKKAPADYIVLKPETVTLGVGLEKGKTYKYEIISTSKGKNIKTIPGMPPDVPETITTMRETLKVRQDPGPLLTVDMTLDSMDMKAQGVPTDQANKFLDALEGAAFTFTMSSEGEVTFLSGMDELWGRLAQTMAGDPTAQQIFAAMKQQLNDQKLKNQMAMMFGFRPSHPVKPGDTWKVAFPLNIFADQPIALDLSYKLKELAAIHGVKSAVITSQSKNQYPGGMPFMQDMMKNMIPDMEIKIWFNYINMDSTAELRLDTSETTRMTTLVNMEMRTLLTPNNGEKEKEIVQNIETSVEMKLLD